jgi:hypothetical protein
LLGVEFIVLQSGKTGMQVEKNTTNQHIPENKTGIKPVSYSNCKKLAEKK